MSKNSALAELTFSVDQFELLPNFQEARLEFHEAFKRCGRLRVPDGSATAACMTELLPLLTAAYGPQRTAFLLRRLAEAVLSETVAPSWQ